MVRSDKQRSFEFTLECFLNELCFTTDVSYTTCWVTGKANPSITVSVRLIYQITILRRRMENTKHSSRLTDEILVSM